MAGFRWWIVLLVTCLVSWLVHAGAAALPERYGAAIASLRRLLQGFWNLQLSSPPLAALATAILVLMIVIRGGGR